MESFEFGPEPRPAPNSGPAVGASFRARLERRLLELPEGESDALMMLGKESRGAWALLLERGGGRALVCGNALSGTSVALATLGFEVWLVDRCAERLRFAAARARSLVPNTTHCVVAGRDARLPFVDGSFGVVALEGGLPSAETGWGFDLEELRRLATHELLVVADNRLGYKRSTGRRGRFLQSPARLLREVATPSRGERALTPTRRLVKGSFGSSAAFALYPHGLEFSHVVALDRARPRLTIGPRERRNRLKMLGARLGLFRWLTPTFAIHARRPTATGPTRIERILTRLAEETGEPCPEGDMLIATRSNDALGQTALPGREGSDPAGRWTIHVPLQPAKRRMVEVHHRWLLQLFGGTLPVPEPLFSGEIEGVRVAVERRVGGWNGTDLTGDLQRTAVLIRDAGERLSSLLEPAPVRMDVGCWRRMLDRRFRRVYRLVPGDSTRARLRSLGEELREWVLSEPVRLAVYHADLRSKHVQVSESGALTAVLDWGASEARFLPLADLLQLIVHQRKQESGDRFGDAWRTVRSRAAWRDYESDAIDGYAAEAGLDGHAVDLLLRTYPLVVAGMAERNWDYSRPDWIVRQFGL